MNGLGMQSRKPLPTRPNQDVGFGPAVSSLPSRVNGNGRKQSISQIPPQAESQSPNAGVLLDGYRKDIINSFEGEKPRFNPMNGARPQSSMLLNLSDPIQVHLLVETALGDSKGFELLSEDEVDDLKKQCQNLTQRIAQTRQNLTIQSKYRDAAISMAKLYSPIDKKRIGDGQEQKKRRSLLGNRNSNSEQVREAELERAASERKCEELAQELWSLERRLMEPQMRLLKHTAGILQMTHKGPVRVPKTNGVAQQGIPGSPESMYTYSNARSSIDPVNEDLFDDRSLYRTFDRLDGLGLGGRRESYEGHGRQSSRSLGQPMNAEQLKTIAKTEQKLEDLNARMREVIMKSKQQGDESYGRPPHSSPNGMSAEPGKMIPAHLNYLEQSIKTIGEEQSHVTRTRQEEEFAMEETIEKLNRDVRALLLPYDQSRPGPPDLTGKSLKNQLNYFQSSIGAIENELKRAATVSSQLKSELARANSVTSKNAASQQGNLEQVETVLTGLWDIIQSGEADVRRRKLQRRQTRTAEGIVDEESDMSGDDSLNVKSEAYSLQAFSSKVQWLFRQATSLKDHKKVLQRQIKQQRELNDKDDEAKDTQRKKMAAELEQKQTALQRTEKDASDLQTQLTSVMERLDVARRETMQRSLEKTKKEDAESAAMQALHAKLLKRNDEIERLEEELQGLKDDQSIGNADIQSRLKDSEASIVTLTAQLAEAQTLEKKMVEKDAEMEKMTMEIARLQTEVTIARAELDGAYGSRAQRAAEVASNPAIQKEIDDLMNRNRTLQAEVETMRNKTGGGGGSQVEQLKRELSETIEEYEVMTKASIEWEKEREMLEKEVDKLRDERESFETQLSDERVRWLGMKSPGADGPNGAMGAGNTSTTVLKNEFKKMMRDTRAENVKALRAEQAERRRVEDELRALKKQQGPGKSGLSQSIS